ncbi:MAG: MFS transporter [Firmicutes bacterium]|nr:MFS transporter [Bacillota bacterium]
MTNFITKHRRWKLTTAILSLSLLTVMAGAAVAPALGLIAEHFRDVDQTLVQMIISIPALFIFITNLFFRPLCKRFRARTLMLIGLALYIIGGCAAGLFSNIWLILIFRAVVGIGVGILMPLSTGLISFYFTKDKQDALMGMSSAMNMMGGVVATLIAGALAQLSWRAAFLVYLMGLISVILALLWMPNERIFDPKEAKKEEGVFKKYNAFIVAMFLLMVSFFIYPANFAMETARSGIIPQQLIAVIMALMDIFGFFGGLAFAGIKKRTKKQARFVAPALFLIGYVLLALPSMAGFTSGAASTASAASASAAPAAMILARAVTLAGSFLVGFANGAGVPFIISTASMKAGRSAATTVMPMISAALYLAQFTTPFITSIIKGGLAACGLEASSYIVAVITSALFLIWSSRISD